MESKANLPAPPAPAADGVPIRPINPRSSSSPPDFLRNIQAAFKRHRSIGNMQSNNIRPKRLLLPRREVSSSSNSSADPSCDVKKARDGVSFSQKQQCSVSQPKSNVSVVRETHEVASVTPPSDWNSTVNTRDQDFRSLNAQGDQIRSFDGYRSNIAFESAEAKNVDVLMVEGQKKVHHAADYSSRSQGADGQMATQKDDLLSHMNSLALTGTEWDVSNQVEAPTVVSQDMRNHNVPNSEMDCKGTAGVSDQPHKFNNFLQSDFSHPMTQSSAIGLSCITTTLINSTSAPMLNSTTHCSQSHQMGSSHSLGERIGESKPKLNYEPVPQKDMMQLLYPSSKNEKIRLPGQEAHTAPNCSTETELEARCSLPGKEQCSNVPKLGDTSNGPSALDGNSAKGDVADMQSDVALSKVSSLDLKAEPSKLEKLDKGTSSKGTSSSRRKNYDPDLFFKVNGKLYQRLGKIGSGGSSEVHKVISSDCTIYALKRIKLKGRDYATAYGFCQEIEYLNRLKGMNNIIQLIDYEVTDKNLLHEVLNGSMNNKDGRVKDDGFIYMVLEYGEIDLAHMLSQKWRELDDRNATIDENWLRFYWQQILLAVNTIHEERIVHSDLKPANFLLVRGSLKLIDFGIAKAIMSDTTNIQRDAQVGTLSYMSPEAFLCNETDANGNIIKCGRPSDIWSLGCILYQMVYGRTPFSEHRTFWAKFKVITDPNHEITYEPVSNPWLLDLMKKCLAWDRNERWRIPQLLQHPFLVPPVPTQPSIGSLPQEQQSCKLLQSLLKSCQNDQNALVLCSRLQQLLDDPRPSKQSESTPVLSTGQQCELLYELSKLCLELRGHLAVLGGK